MNYGSFDTCERDINELVEQYVVSLTNYHYLQAMEREASRNSSYDSLEFR